MKLVRVFAQFTDHDYHGCPVETTRVELFVDDSVTPYIQQELEQLAKERLHSMCKRMPHRYTSRSHTIAMVDGFEAAHGRTIP